MQYTALTKPAEFKNTYKGIKFYTACFSVHFIKREHVQTDMVHYGITVSKKTAGNAVMRNLMKRRIKESFRQYALCPELAPYQIVFTAIRKAHERTWDDYMRAMKKLSSLIEKYQHEAG